MIKSNIYIMEDFPEKILEEIRNKVDELSNWQKPRIASELCDKIASAFIERKIKLKRPLFSTQSYIITLDKEVEEGMYIIYHGPFSSSIGYKKENLEVDIDLEPASIVPGFKNEVFFGRIPAFRDVPVKAKINDLEKIFHYKESELNLGDLGFS